MDTLIRGLSTTVIGIVTVIVILGIIALVITLMGYIMKKAEKPKAEAPKEDISDNKATPLATSASPDLTEDYALVAAITAAISAYTGMSPQRFKIFGIKPSDSNEWRKTNRKSSDC